MRYLKLRTESQISLMNILKSKGPERDPCGTPDFTTYEKESVLEIRTDDAYWLDSCETD
jgi:hypothetical protein